MPKLGLYSSGWGVTDTVQFGASDFWRLAVPGRELARNGWDVVPARSIGAAPDGHFVLADEHDNLHDDCDVVLWQRYMGAGAPEAIRRARACGQAVVNDVDDYYWALPRENVAHRHTDPRRNPHYNRDIYRDVIKASTLVTVSTPFLERALQRWGPPVRTVRNYIALDKWRLRPPGEYVGWVGVVSWRGADLQLLSKTVVPWLRGRCQSFYHGGHLEGSRSASDALGYDRVLTSDVTDLPRYPRLWDRLRVALVPIELSTFGHSKSWVKGLEACARGIPFVASDHPEYRALGAGRLARRPRDWVTHLEALEDPDFYQSECERNRSRAEELSIAHNWHHWDVVLREALAEEGNDRVRRTDVQPAPVP